MARPEDPGSQGQGNRPQAGQPNPAGHQRGNERPEGMTDAEWEAQRDAVNKARFEERQGRPRPEGDEDDADEEVSGQSPTSGGTEPTA